MNNMRRSCDQTYFSTYAYQHPSKRKNTSVYENHQFWDIRSEKLKSYSLYISLVLLSRVMAAENGGSLRTMVLPWMMLNTLM